MGSPTDPPPTVPPAVDPDRDPDPAAARRALEVARHQRQRVAAAAGEPWWLWCAGLVLLFALLASRDFGEAVRTAAQLTALGVPVLLLAARRVPRLSGVLGRVSLHRSVVPAWARVTVAGAGASAAVAVFSGRRVAAEVLAALGAPGWWVAHPRVASGAVFTVLVTVLAWVVDRVVRRRVGAGR